MLPARVQGRTRWYGVAPSDREARLLLEEVEAWLGAPVTTGGAYVTAKDDAVDASAALLHPGGIVIRADVEAGWQSEARENVRSLVDLWAITPERSSDERRPVGRVLRYFYEAIAARDRTSAVDAFEEIRYGGLLSPSNVRFLRVELLGLLGQPQELLDDPLLQDVTMLRRPPEVTDHLARAADALYVPESVVALDDDAVRHVAATIEASWPGLIEHPSQLRSVSGARCLALVETLAERPRPGVVEALRLDWSEDALVARVVQMLAESPVPAELHGQPSVSLVLRHYQAGEFELTLDTAEREAPDRGVAPAVLHAAVNLGDANAAARAVAYVNRLPVDDRDNLLAQAAEAHFYELLLSHNEGPDVPNDWLDWLRSEWPDRPDLLHEWSSGWRTEELTEAFGAQLAGELLDALNDQRRGRVRNGLPALLRWIVTDDGLAPASIPLAVTILEIMLGSDPGRAERRAGLDLFGAVLETGCSAPEYRDVLAAIGEQMAGLGPREADWLVGVLDLQLLSPVPDTAARSELFGEALGIAVSWYERIDRTEATLLSKVFSDGGMHFEVPADESAGQASRVQRVFGSVGIYSLSESAAQNARRWIEEEWPGVTVRLSHAHENNSELAGLVQTSDVLLMQTSHAKHAATIAIERSVETNRLVRVNGRGATSLLRGLFEWAGTD